MPLGRGFRVAPLSGVHTVEMDVEAAPVEIGEEECLDMAAGLSMAECAQLGTPFDCSASLRGRVTPSRASRATSAPSRATETGTIT